MTSKRWFYTETGFALLSKTNSLSIGAVSGPFRVQVESMEQAPDSPFRILARATRADVWHAELLDGARFVLRIRDRDTGRLIRVVMARGIAERFAAKVMQTRFEQQEEMDEAA